MEIYILAKQDLSILSICKVSDYEINLDEETNAKSIFNVMKTEGLKKGNFLVVNGLYKQFLFLIDDVETEKGSEISTVTALDISNIFDRKVIEKNTNTMTESSIEQFIANTISANFVNLDDSFLNVGYIDIYWHTNTQGVVATNAEDGLYNFHTFLINCRQYKNIYTEFQFVNGRLRIDIRSKEESTRLVDATLPEVTDYNKVYDNDITAKVTVYIRENGSEYNLYLKTDRTTTENKNDPNRAEGKIEVISVDTADVARTEALNVMKGNTYKHLVEFKIAKSSKLMDVTGLYIGRNIRIRTDDDIYDSYISAITIKDENFVYFKSGNLRTTLLDKLKQEISTNGNKLDVSGGVIKGNLYLGQKLYEKNDLDVYEELTNQITVSPTEPVTDRRKVWMKKGKNAFNAYQYSYSLRNSSESYVINSANSISVSGNDMSWSRASITVKNLLPNTKYTVSADVSNPSGHWCGIVVFQGENELTNVSNIVPFKPKITFTSNNDGTITINLFSNWSSSSLTETVVFNQIQLEQGEQKTYYEAHVEPSTYIKNDNDVYEVYKNNSKNIMHNGKILEDVLNDFPSKDIYTNMATNIDDVLHSCYLNAMVGTTAGNLPTGIGGNQWLIFTAMSNPTYNAQLAFGFGSTKIGMRTRSGSTTWSDWKYVTLT